MSPLCERRTREWQSSLHAAWVCGTDGKRASIAVAPNSDGSRTVEVCWEGDRSATGHFLLKRDALLWMRGLAAGVGR